MNSIALFHRRASIRSRLGLAGFVALSLFASGCSVLGRAAPDTSRYFVLSSTNSSIGTTPARSRGDLHFGLGPVRLPGYLDVQSLVRTGDRGSVEYVRSAYWAEPVATAFPRALLYRTGWHLGTTHAIAYPWYSTTRVDWKVPVDVLRFEATTNGTAVLVARWSVERSSDHAIFAGSESVFEETTGSDPAGSDPAAIVEALGRCIDRLAETLAAALADAEIAPIPKARSRASSAPIAN